MSKKKDQGLEDIKKVIKEEFPEARISVLDNPRDYASGLIHVSNVPSGFKARFYKIMDFVTIQLDSETGGEYLVVPIPAPPELTPVRQRAAREMYLE